MQSTTPATRVYLLPPQQVVKGVPPIASACDEELRAEFALQSTAAHTLTRVLGPGI